MFIHAAILFLLVAALFSGYRIIRGPSVWDRLLGFSLLSSKIILVIILYSFESGHSYYLDIGLTFALLSFVGTTSISKFLRKAKK